MIKINKKLRRVILVLLLLITCSSSKSEAITKYEFLAALLEARGIDWSSSPEAVNNNGWKFITRTGYITDDVPYMSQQVTRREALRWCIESLGLSFEAALLSDYPMSFKDFDRLNDFERGCLVVGCNMKPQIFTQSDLFRGTDALSNKESEAILSRVKAASKNFRLDIIRNPLQGMRVLIHREGVPTGIPNWRVQAEGIKDKGSADNLKTFLKANGFEMTSSKSGNVYVLRSQKLEDYDQARSLTALIQSRGVRFRAIPVMSNPKTNIVPKYWVMLTIDPTYWKIMPITAGNGGRNLWTLSGIAQRNKARAAINAGFFGIVRGTQGFPIGSLKINGNVLSDPYDNRGALGWNDNDEAVFSVAGSEQIPNWLDMTNIIQAGPLLLDEGRYAVVDEGFDNALISVRHPRSAVGLTEGGEWVFMLVDGRNGMHSSGATISELAGLMKTYNIQYALNLDGGGSSEIIINGKIYNWPSDGRERLISYGLGAISIK
ncbi:MAG: phosphodiester glycosidase family protein [Synergistaceae bacterium]|nr:phosphodiester glycosidase family protein [Synergistaceae bacterium]